MSGSPRLKWLLGLLLVMVVLGVWLRGSSEPIDVNESAGSKGAVDFESDAPAPRPPASAPAAAPAAVEVLALDTEALDRLPPGYRVGRDPWRFVEPPPPPPPPPYRPPTLSAEELRRQREAEEAARRAAEEALRQQQIEAARPKPPPFPYTCIGHISSKSGKRIFILMSEDGRQVLNVEQGETIGGQFIVARAGLESLEIKFVGFPDWPPTIVPVPVSR